jgi:hypothetical protein
LIHKPGGPDSIEQEYYYVDPKLRAKIRDDLSQVRIFPYFSTTARQTYLWIVKVSVDNSWYKSLQDRIFRQPPKFFEQKEIKIIAAKELSRYRVKQRERSVKDVPWPVRPVAELLGEAIGKDHFITAADHPLYAELVSGEEI